MKFLPEKVIKCKICFDEYNNSVKKPYSLSCGHTFCIQCINRLMRMNCPTCECIIRNKIPNYDLIEIIESIEATENFKKNIETKLDQIKGLSQKLEETNKEREENFKQVKEKICIKTEASIKKLLESKQSLLNQIDLIQNEKTKEFDLLVKNNKSILETLNQVKYDLVESKDLDYIENKFRNVGIESKINQIEATLANKLQFIEYEKEITVGELKIKDDTIKSISNQITKAIYEPRKSESSFKKVPIELFIKQFNKYH